MRRAAGVLRPRLLAEASRPAAATAPARVPGPP
jgi:hypothetical protein